MRDMIMAMARSQVLEELRTRLPTWFYDDWITVVIALLVCITLSRFVLNYATRGLWTWIEWSALSIVYVFIFVVVMLVITI